MLFTNTCDPDFPAIRTYVFRNSYLKQNNKEKGEKKYPFSVVLNIHG